MRTDRATTPTRGPMAKRQYVIQVLGTTYRIHTELDCHHVFRVRDDRRVGMFEHQPTLRVVQSEIDAEHLLEVARAASRAALLPWPDFDRPRAPSRHDQTASARPATVSRGLTRLLVELLAEPVKRAVSSAR